MSVTLVPTDHYSGGNNLNKGARSAPDAATLEETVNAALTIVNANEAYIVKSMGSAAVVQAIQAGQPSNTDTLDVGADTYQFLSSPAGATGDIEVEIGASAEITLNNLLAAAVASGTENLYWDKLSATVLRLRSASAPQGTITGADPSIVLDASGATNWSFDVGDVNMNTLAGKAGGPQLMASTSLTITTAMITATTVRIAFPFTPTSFTFSAVTSGGVPVGITTDAFNISGDDIVLTLGTDLANTNVVHITAYA